MRAPDLLARLRQPSVIAGASALAVAGIIAANALWLQGGHHHPSPFFATRQDGAKPDETLRALQTALKREGLYDGPVDGLPGPRTTAAIRSFEAGVAPRPSAAEANGAGDSPLSPTAGPSAPAAAPAALTPAPAAVPSVSPEQVATVQRALSAAAYGSLTADGIFGQQTRDAIAKFQSDHGLQPSGEITDTLIVELKAAGALGPD